MAEEGNTHLEAVARVSEMLSARILVQENKDALKACPRDQALRRERLVNAQ